MALHYLQVTIGAANTQISSTRIPCRQVIVQNNAAHSCRVADKNVSSTKGALLNASGGAGQGGGTMNFGPFQAYNTDLTEWWINGTQNDVIDVLYVQ